MIGPTGGPGEHRFKAERLLRGAGEPVVKFARLLSVSVQPFKRRRIAVVLLGAGAGEASAAFDDPYPTKSLTWEEAGALPDKRPLPRTSAIFPAVAFKLMSAVASGVGKALPGPPTCS